jgi:hypothetical protein
MNTECGSIRERRIGTVQVISRRKTIRYGALLSIVVGSLFAAPLNRAYGQSPPVVSFKVTISPSEAVAAGAQWRLKGETAWRDSDKNYTLADLPIGVYTIEFKPIPGWIPPETSRPRRIVPGISSGTSLAYKKIPFDTLTVTATNGYVGARDFPDESLPAVNSTLLAALQFEALYASHDSSFEHTPPNTNYWVYLLGVPLTGYQFNGWSGSATGSRNPMVIQMNVNKEIAALFTPVPLHSFTATHMADNYLSPGNLVVNCQASYPIDRRLLSLNWRPILPAGWTLISATGMDNPVTIDGAVVVTGAPVENNPVQFNLLIQVPNGELGSQEIRGEITYTLDGMTEPTTDIPTPNPLVILGQESPAPVLTVRQPSGLPALEIRGGPGQAYVLEQTSYLSPSNYWQWLGVVALTNTTQTWLDTQAATNQPMRFYRVRRFQ